MEETPHSWQNGERCRGESILINCVLPVFGTNVGKDTTNNDDLMCSLGFVRVFNSGNLVFVKR